MDGSAQQHPDRYQTPPVRRISRMMLRRWFLSAFIALAGCGVGPAILRAAAQEAYPSKPIRLIVPLAAGGGIDFTARTTAQKLSEVLGQQVVVENQGGAGGTLGVSAVVRAAPDGYTLLYHSVSGVVSAAVSRDLPYEWLRDLTPVSLVPVSRRC
jgi:tripartite-type tricarboxylate transporter receptor subunit TctC